MTDKVNNAKLTHRGKADTSCNNDRLQHVIENMQEKHRIPLRVDKRTIILVTPEYYSDSYAKEWKNAHDKKPETRGVPRGRDYSMIDEVMLMEMLKENKPYGRYPETSA